MSYPPYPLAAFHLLQNYIWVLRDHTHAWVVDPGDAQIVAKYLQAEDLMLAGILITHHHWDHTDGAAALSKEYNAPIFGPDQSAYKEISHPLKDGDSVKVLSHDLSVITVPGHTMDHIAFYKSADAEFNPWLFSGDVLFAAGCGRVFEGTFEMMWQSLSSLAKLPAETEVYCGHEYTVDNLRFAVHIEPSNLEVAKRLQVEQDKRAKELPTLPSQLQLERRTNPFLRADCKILLESLRAHAYLGGDDPVAVFTELRTQKDNF